MHYIFANADLLPLECCRNKHTRIATVFSIQSILIADFFLYEMSNSLGSSKLILRFPGCMYQRRQEAVLDTILTLGSLQCQQFCKKVCVSRVLKDYCFPSTHGNCWLLFVPFLRNSYQLIF
jgi:hypothetical protein